MASESTSTNAEMGLERPPFRGCVFCYTAEMSVYGVRRLVSGVGSGED
jgi:hypothetical protein